MKNLVTPDVAASMTVDHPDFRYVMEWSVTGYPVVVFERPTYLLPSELQLQDYRNRRALVEENGGRMSMQEYEIGGYTSLFTAEDCDLMREAVVRSLPGWIARDSWNGKGCRTYSVAIEPVTLRRQRNANQRPSFCPLRRPVRV